jgi:hypothetical protein
MLRFFSRSCPACLALFAMTACAGGSMEASTSVADTIDEDSGGVTDGDGDEGVDDGSATAADDSADAADESPSDEGSSDDAASDGAATGEGSTDDGAAESSGDATDDGTTTDDGGTTTDDGTTTGEPGSVDLSGFVLVQTDSAREIVLPDATIVPVGGAIVIGRDALVGEFEDFWGISFSSDVVYIDGIDNFPTCNGDETYTLLTPLRTVVDGPTPALAVSTSLTRVDASMPADDPSAWSSSAAPNLDGTPGTDEAAGGQTGVPYIAEIVDATGAGNFPYEYIEIRVAP